MDGIRSLFLRILMIVSPLVLVTLVVAQFSALSKLEVSLLSLLAAVMPWLFYEVIQRHHQHAKSTKTIKQFHETLDKVYNALGDGSGKEEFLAQAATEEMIEKEVASAPKKAAKKAKKVDPVPEVVQEPVESAQADLSPDPEPAAQAVEVIEPEVVEEIPVAEPMVNETQSQALSREELVHNLSEALKADQIEVLLQPIVSLPQRKAKHFEFFSRVRQKDGTILTPENYLHLAEEEDMIRLVDNAMLFRSIQMARSSIKKNFSVRFFCNVSPQSLFDKQFLENVEDFLKSNKEVAQCLVFEFHEKALAEHIKTLGPILKKLRLYECKFSIDQVETLNLNFKVLKNLNFNYVKLHSPILMPYLENEEGEAAIKAFQKQCKLNSIDVIVSHVEEEKLVKELSDYGFAYGQGFLFGKPVLSKQ